VCNTIIFIIIHSVWRHSNTLCGKSPPIRIIWASIQCCTLFRYKYTYHFNSYDYNYNYFYYLLFRWIFLTLSIDLSSYLWVTYLSTNIIIIWMVLITRRYGFFGPRAWEILDNRIQFIRNQTSQTTILIVTSYHLRFIIIILLGAIITTDFVYHVT